MSALTGSGSAIGLVPPLSSVILSLLIIGILALVSQAVYNRYFHPLRKIPGPFWASISRVWWLLVATGGKQHKIHVACHEKYGPIVRIAPHYVMINDPVYATQFYKWDRSDYTLPFEMVPGEPGMVAQADMRAHAKQRRKVASGFTLSAVLQSEDVIDKHINDWISQLSKISLASLSAPLDLAPWTQWLAMDAVMDVVFSSPVGFILAGADVSNLLASIQDLFLLSTLLCHLPGLLKFLQGPLTWPFLAPKASDKNGVGFVQGVANEAVKRRLEDGNIGGKRDVLQHWLEYRGKEGEKMSEHELQVEALGPISVGADTTASTIRALILYVATSPRVYSTLMSSIFSLPPNTKHPIPFLTAQKLPYLQAIISETLRMYSPVGMPLSRVIPSSGATVLSHQLPGGTWIMMPQWCIGRSKSIWGEDADVFRPERWLQQESESTDQFTERLESWRKNDITWGKGDVTCVGKNIAMMEIYKVAVELFLNFDVQIVNPEQPWKTKNIMIFIHEEFWVRLTPRVPSPSSQVLSE